MRVNPLFSEGDRFFTSSDVGLLREFRNKSGTVLRVSSMAEGDDPQHYEPGPVVYHAQFDEPISGRGGATVFYVDEAYMLPPLPPVETIAEVEAFLNG